MICTTTSSISPSLRDLESIASVSDTLIALHSLIDIPAAHILAPGAYARMPIVDRIAALKIPVTFVCA